MKSLELFLFLFSPQLECNPVHFSVGFPGTKLLSHLGLQIEITWESL